MFSSLQARMMRTAISPRFATRIFSNMWQRCYKRSDRARWPPVSVRDQAKSDRSNLEQGLAELNGFGVFDQDLSEHAFDLGLDFVHDLIASMIQTTLPRLTSEPISTKDA